MNLLVKNISQLVTIAAHGKRFRLGPEMQDLGIIQDAGVLCRDGKIAWVGPMASFVERLPEDMPELDAKGTVVLPGFVDSHTHMMFAGDRAEEFGMRAHGMSYQEIAEKGGGILNTIRHVRAASKKELKRSTAALLWGMMKHGTTTVEIKSGYGLDMDTEIRMLEAIHELGEEEMATVIPTFIGAHAVPPEFKHDPEGYVRLLLEK
jgi:imidazolonepropionase